jgi:hypothetical protein
MGDRSVNITSIASMMSQWDLAMHKYIDRVINFRKKKVCKNCEHGKSKQKRQDHNLRYRRNTKDSPPEGWCHMSRMRVAV